MIGKAPIVNVSCTTSFPDPGSWMDQVKSFQGEIVNRRFLVLGQDLRERLCDELWRDVCINRTPMHVGLDPSKVHALQTLDIMLANARAMMGINYQEDLDLLEAYRVPLPKETVTQFY